MNYRLSHAAKQDIIAIYLDGVRQFGLAQADDYHHILQATFELIAQHPKMGALRSDVEPQVRMHPCGSHIIIYTVDAKSAFILRIRHHRENWLQTPLN